MKCQCLFSEKSKKNVISLLSAEFAQRVLANKCVFRMTYHARLSIFMGIMSMCKFVDSDETFFPPAKKASLFYLFVQCYLFVLCEFYIHFALFLLDIVPGLHNIISHSPDKKGYSN